MIARSLFIHGHVQGVFFREWTVSRAREMGISGWVRNLRDGKVEVYAVGEPAAIAKFAKRLHEGSPASRVDSVEEHEAAVERVDGFTRRQTL